MVYDVTVQIDGKDIRCGTLRQSVRHGRETAMFSYDPAYLSSSRAFSIAPDMPLGPGTFHSEGLRDFRAFEDAMPDRWGRNLLLRLERLEAKRANRTERTLFDLDMLVGVSDETRQGALRIWGSDGSALAMQGEGVPREVSIPDLLDASDLAAHDLDADVRDLVAAGSSLGGARPKASVRANDGALCIAKFPKADEDALVDSAAWEKVMLQLMKRAGIAVPESRLLRVGGRSVLLVKRFDREGDVRIPYISGLTAVQGRDGQSYSYLDLVEFIEGLGADPARDLPELWRRALFSCAVGNTDNHLRNYGFLHTRAGWALSPVFDVNPTVGGGEKYLATSLDYDRPEADPRIAIEVAGYFRVSGDEARRSVIELMQVLRSWRYAARSARISEASIKAMETNMSRGMQALEKALAG